MGRSSSGGGTPPRAHPQSLLPSRPPRPERMGDGGSVARALSVGGGSARGGRAASGGADVSVDSADTYQASLFSDAPPVVVGGAAAEAGGGSTGGARAGRLRVAVRCRPPFPEEVSRCRPRAHTGGDIGHDVPAGGGGRMLLLRAAGRRWWRSPPPPPAAARGLCSARWCGQRAAARASSCSTVPSDRMRRRCGGRAFVTRVAAALRGSR